MIQTFERTEWATVLPRSGVFASPYLEPMSIVTPETGGTLQECFGCGQLREDVAAVDVGLDSDGSLVDVCGDCRREHGE